MSATTRAAFARVTLGERNYGPFTTRKKRGGEHWFREKNGRRVLRISDGRGHQRFWRAPKPRPRPNRRANKSRRQEILREVSNDNQVYANIPDSAEVICVLQSSLKNAWRKTEAAEAKAESAEQKLKDMIATSARFAEQVALGEVTNHTTAAHLHSDKQSNEGKTVKTLRGQLNAATRRSEFYRDRLNQVVSWWSHSVKEYDNYSTDADTVMQAYVNRRLLKQYELKCPSQKAICKYQRAKTKFLRRKSPHVPLAFAERMWTYTSIT